MPEALSDALLASVLADCAGDRSGEVPADVPRLAGADPDHLGLSVATVEGELHEAGDARAPFCLQSIAKAFTYALAVADRGVETVDAHVDLEPSGDSYNEISLHPRTGHPSNPMINAGALVACALVGGGTVDARFARILDLYARAADRRLAVDEDVLAMEREHAWRNRAIASLLREFAIIEEHPDGPVELHARQSAVVVDARDLARMGAVLAAGGRQPCTGEQLLEESVVRRVLSVMGTCGMYDDTGAWVARVGLPAKSGVGGAILAVAPGRYGIAAYSPRLDDHGASVRGGAALQALSERMGLHLMGTSARR